MSVRYSVIYLTLLVTTSTGFVTFAQVSNATSRNETTSKPAWTFDLEYTYLGSTPYDDTGFRSQSVYLFSNRKSNWPEAVESCGLKYNGNLVALDTKNDERRVRALMIGHEIDKIWTDGSYYPSIGQWAWSSMDENNVISSSQQIWNPGQPIALNKYSRIVLTLNALHKIGYDSASQFEYFDSICEI